MLRNSVPVLVLLVTAGCAAPNPYIAQIAGEENLALGAAYSLEPPPNYPGLAADASVALHDGVLTECDPGRAPTLAWHLPGGDPVRIVIDLGRPRAIQEVVLHVGTRRFKPPAKIHVQTSNNGRFFQTVATRTSMKRFDLRTGALLSARFAGTARYVRLEVWPDGEHLCLDEVAIFPRVMTAR